MKKTVSLLALASFVASSSGCVTLKLPDSKPGSSARAAICEKRTAVFVLEDRRTETKIDRYLDDKPSVAVSKALADKFREHCPDKVEFIDRQVGAAEVKLSSASTAKDDFDYLLTGTLDQLHSEYEDKYQALRMTGAFVAGLTVPVGLLLMPVVMAGDADHVTDFNFTVSLVEASTGTILYTGRSEFKDRERVAIVKASVARIEEKLNTHMERATSAMFANISSAYKSKHEGVNTFDILEKPQ